MADLLIRMGPTAAHLGYADEIVADQILTALPQECQEACILQKYRDLRELVDIADRWLALKRSKNPSSSNVVSFQATNEETEEIARLTKEIERLTRLTSDDTQRRSRKDQY